MTNQKRLTTILIASLLALFAASLPGVNQKNDQAEMLLQRAQQKELVDGQPEAAIQIYKDILSRYPKNRTAVAKALVAMGQCYEKLGDAQAREARKAYERVVREYADQSDLAAQARTRLAALAQGAPVGEKGSGIIFRQIRFDGLEKTPFSRLSPDGKKMLYVHVKEKDPQYSLCIMNLVSGQDQPLVENFGGITGSFQWSPDGSKVVYTHQRRQLRVISAKGGEPQPVWSSPDPAVSVYPLDWSRDSRYILAAVVNVTEGVTRLAILPVVGGEPRFVVSGKQGELEDEGRFSPDGKFIVGERTRGSDTNVYVWAADSGQETLVTKPPANEFGPLWSPDGKYLVFMSDRMKTWDLWAVPMSGGAPAGVPFRIKQGLGRSTRLTGFTSAGQLTMLLVGEGTPADLFILPVDRSTGEARGEFTPLAKYPTGHFSPRWSPDGKRVAYTSRKGQLRWPSIFVNSPDGKEEQEVPVESHYVGSVEWWPDGAHLVFGGFIRDGSVGIFRISLPDHMITPLHLGGPYGPGFQGAFVNVQWLPQAKKFMFAKLIDKDAVEIYTMDSDGKQVQRVAEKVPTSAWTWPSPDGSQVAYREGQDLKLLSTADKTSVTLATFPQGTIVSGPAWSLDARKVAFTDKRQLKVLSAAGGTPKVLVEAPETCEIGGTSWWSGIAWSPDGTSIAYLLKKASKVAGAGSELWVVPAAGGTPRKIAAAPASHPRLTDVIWHPSGDMIVTTGEAGEQGQKGYGHWVLENFLPVPKAAKQ